MSQEAYCICCYCYVCNTVDNYLRSAVCCNLESSRVLFAPKPPLEDVGAVMLCTVSATLVIDLQVSYAAASAAAAATAGRHLPC